MTNNDPYNQEILRNNPNIPAPMFLRADELQGGMFYIRQAIPRKEKEVTSFIPEKAAEPQLAFPQQQPKNPAATFAVENTANDPDAARTLVEEAFN